MSLGSSGARRIALATGLVAGLLHGSFALAQEATGNLVWVDERNSMLLLECIEGGCGKIPSAKTGETYTFVIPDNLRAAVKALKEGQKITVSYRETKDQGYHLSTVK